MAFIFKEQPDSGASTHNPPAVTLKYVASGSNDRSFVKGYALMHTDPVVAVTEGNLYRQDVRVDPGGHKVFYVTVPYAPRKYQVGQFRFTTSSTGGTLHVKASRQTVAKYPSSAKDHKQLIGVHGDNVDGADIVIPAMKLTCHFKHPAAVFSLPYAFYLADLTGSVNSDVFLGRPPGTLLYLGHDGSDGTDAEAEVAYHFAYEKNLENLVFGSITGVAKQGWDLLWISWKDNVTGNEAGREPKAVYVERVYQRIAMATAFGFGG